MHDPFAAYLEWLADSSFSALVPHVRTAPVDVLEYEEVLRCSGFVLPPSLRALLLAHGLVGHPVLWGDFPGWGRSTCGLSMEDPDALFDNHLHQLAEADAEVPAGGSWLVFATMRGDLDGAYALDRRFREGHELSVGTYHQDDVCHESREGVPLWDAQPSFGAWLESFFAAVRTGLARTAPDELARQIDELGEPMLPPSRPSKTSSWQETWAALEREGHPWRHGTWPRYRTVLREADDLTVVERIASWVRADLDGKKGRAVVPGLSQDQRSGHWTTGLPGPVDLLARLPEHGRWGRREVMRWALSRCGVAPEGSVADAIAMLEALATPGEVDDDARRTLALRCADLGWSTFDPRTEPPAGKLARASGWALGRAKPRRIAHVLSLAHRIRKGSTNGMELSARRLWDLLLRVVLQGPQGVDAPPMRTTVEPAAEMLELQQWLAAHEGTQRERLAALEREWLERLQAMPEALGADAARLIRRAIKSKKLVVDRDAFLATVSKSRAPTDDAGQG